MMPLIHRTRTILPQAVATLFIGNILVFVLLAVLGSAKTIHAYDLPISDRKLNSVADSDHLLLIEESNSADIPLTLLTSASWLSNNSDSTLDMAWGDVDNDGDLDLAVGNWQGPNRLYLNENGRISINAVWSSNDLDDTRSVAWGDVDNDGDLDLAVGNDTGTPNKLYFNEGGMLSTNADWISTEADSTYSVAWGDVDNDGDLDLVAGNWEHKNRLYLNDNGTLSPNSAWSSSELDETRTVAWGDVDGDGDLDLAVGNDKYQPVDNSGCEENSGCYVGAPNRIYLNTGGVLSSSADWSSNDSEPTWSVAWGDVDGDGDLDLAVGNDQWDRTCQCYMQGSVQLYRNEAGILTKNPIWTSDESASTYSIAWGDVDGDGDLDLVAGNDRCSSTCLKYIGGASRIYLNEGGILSTSANWSSDESLGVKSVAWGDVDNDGDLDLAISNDYGVPNRLHLNEDMILSATGIWSSTQSSPALSIAWGDVDNDGDLDLAVGTENSSPNQLYLNENGILSSTPVWTSNEFDQSKSVAWGDVDNDGDLDLAVGNDHGLPNRLYLNENGTLSSNVVWSSNDRVSTLSVAWGDVDNDGDLDLAAGNWQTTTQIYLNTNGQLSTAADWFSLETDENFSIAWGDVDNDGDLDLAVGNWNTPNRLYRNEGGVLTPSADWSSDETDETFSIAWGDVDGDGDLDLIAGNHNSPNRLYLNNQGMLSTTADWSSSESDLTRSVAWGDVDGDGDLDLAVGNDQFDSECDCHIGAPNRIYLNEDGSLPTTASWTSDDSHSTFGIAWGDIDNDGDPDLAAGNVNAPEQLYLNRGPSQLFFQRESTIQLGQIASQDGKQIEANFYAMPDVHASGVMTIPYQITLPVSQTIRGLSVTYSLNGGGAWHPSVGQIISNDLLNGVYRWDIYASAFFGQSDNVVVRLEAHLNCINSCMRASITTQSFPLRVRGTQVRVLKGDRDNLPAAGSVVYKLPKGQLKGAAPFVDASSRLLHTDAAGYLQGRGQLNVGDRLFAMMPSTTTNSSVLYETSATPTSDGLDWSNGTVDSFGVQTLYVSLQNALILFNLDLSLEWDASNDEAYLKELVANLKRTSEVLYDWSNGQAALGQIRVYQDRERWGNAHIHVHASNRLRPHATIGGVVPNLQVDELQKQVGQQIETMQHLYSPGHVEMSATWNRYGDQGGNLAEDWPRTLAHELGHYLFYLHDNYVGLDEDNHIMRIDGCPGAMSDPYDDPQSEFHPEIGWTEACNRTFSHVHLGRHDWATIVAHYEALQEPSGTVNTPENPGPASLPLDVTDVQVMAPLTPTMSIAVPTFSLVPHSGGTYQPSHGARAFLFQGQGLIDLGRPERDSIHAYNARPGNTLCVYDLTARHTDGTAAPLTACKVVNTGGEEIRLTSPGAEWQPEVVIVPQSAHTLTVQVHLREISSGTLPALEGQLYGGERLSSRLHFTLSYDNAIDGYRGTAIIPQKLQKGYLHIFDPNNQARGVVVDYTLGGAPVLTLDDGDVINLHNGAILQTIEGETITLENGTVIVFPRQNAFVLVQQDGTVLTLDDGDVLTLDDGDVLTPDNGDVIPLSQGDVLTLDDGDIILRTDGNVLTLDDGDVVTLSGNMGYVLHGRNARVLGSGNVLTLDDGDVLTLDDGDVLTLDDGDVLTLDDGDVISLNNGDVTLWGDSEIAIEGSGNVIFFGQGSTSVRSSDGQVSLYGRSLKFQQGQFYTLQPTSIIPDVPIWLTTVGQGYRVTATPGSPSLEGVSISMNYSGRTINSEKEFRLKVYYRNTDTTLPIDEQQWQRLDTKVDTKHNIATAKAVGQGVYMLMYSIDQVIPGGGWSQFSYPVAYSLPITIALSSIDPHYQIVYHANQVESDPLKRWRVFAKPTASGTKLPVPGWVSSLHMLEPHKIYLINVTHPSSLTIHFPDVNPTQVRAAQHLMRPDPPATYYGILAASQGFTPTVGTTIEARIGDERCGISETRDVGGKIGYVIIVSPDSDISGCGAPGSTVTFTVGGSKNILPDASWQTSHINQNNSVNGDMIYQICLPIVMQNRTANKE